MSQSVLLDLFSGLGGFSLAAGWLGFRTAAFVEIDPFCKRVLAKHWPEVPIYGDIRDVTAVRLRGDGVLGGEAVGVGNNADRLGLDGLVRSIGGGSTNSRSSGRVASPAMEVGIDIITGGFPCQGFSHAGKRLGTADDRYLWPEMRRVIDELRPRFVCAENVPGIISLALDEVLSDLEAIGYACGAVVVPAAAVNAPHRRDRVWILAHAGGAGRSEVARSAYGDEAADEGRSTQHSYLTERDGQGGRTRITPDAASFRRERHQPFAGSDGAGEREGRVREPQRDGQRQIKRGVDTCVDGLPEYLARPRLNPWDGDWEAGLPRTTEHEPERVAKLKAIGNSIVPHVAYEVLRALIDPTEGGAADHHRA